MLHAPVILLRQQGAPMKISIEIDLEASEIDLATELLATLR